jgi:TadE-like protein
MRWISKLRRGARLLRKNKSGSSAIEFAMVIGPFMGLVFAIIEVALTYFAQIGLELGNTEAMRRITTGSAQNGNMSQAQYKALVCSKLFSFMKCDENLIIDVRSYPTFSEALANMPDLFDEGGGRTMAKEKYCTGGPSQVVIGTLYYKWTFIMGMPGLGDFTGKMGISLANSPDGSRLMIAGFARKNEPFSMTGAPPPGC